MPVFVGDDTTDEDGFAAAESGGGYGIKVGDGPSRALYRCRDVPELHAWMQASLGGVSEEAGHDHGRSNLPPTGGRR
jgi:trehalose 6-phosphate phosphatase